jgi:hypothetical protein
MISDGDADKLAPKLRDSQDNNPLIDIRYCDGVPRELGPCKLYLGSAAKRGRGYLKLAGSGDREFRARRVAAVLAGYALDDTKPFIMNYCGQSHCIEPTHLFSGDFKTLGQHQIRFGKRDSIYLSGVLCCRRGHPLAGNRTKRGRCQTCFDSWESLNSLLRVRAKRVTERIQRAVKAGNLPWRDVTLDEVLAAMVREQVDKIFGPPRQGDVRWDLIVADFQQSLVAGSSPAVSSI